MKRVKGNGGAAVVDPVAGKVLARPPQRTVDPAIGRLVPSRELVIHRARNLADRRHKDLIRDVLAGAIGQDRLFDLGDKPPDPPSPCAEVSSCHGYSCGIGSCASGDTCPYTCGDSCPEGTCADSCVETCNHTCGDSTCKSNTQGMLDPAAAISNPQPFVPMFRTFRRR